MVVLGFAPSPVGLQFLPSFPSTLPLPFLPSLLPFIGQTFIKLSVCHALGLLKGTRLGQRAVVGPVQRQRWPPAGVGFGNAWAVLGCCHD